MGDCGDPRQAGFPNAWDCDLSDGVVDFFADVFFATNGEVYAPVLITRYVANAPLPNTEWVQLRNVAPVGLSLYRFKVSDEEQPDVSMIETMAIFEPCAPGLAPGQTLVVAKEASVYLTRYGTDASCEFASTSPEVQDMSRFVLWGSGPPGSFALNNLGDQILLLDRSNTILDVVNYGTGAFVGVTPAPAPAADQVFGRMPVARDTDDNSADFRVVAEDLLFADGFED